MEQTAEILNLKAEALTKDLEDGILLESRLKADKFILLLLWAHLPIATFLIPINYGTQTEGFIASLVICFLGSLSYWAAKGTLSHRILNGLLALSYSVVLITLQYGRIEMHFHIFAIFPLLLLYKDWKVYPLPILLIAFHHAAFNYCQINGIEIYGMPLIVFNYGNGWDIVLLHTVFVIFETSFLMYFSNVFKEQYIFIAKSNENLHTTVKQKTKEINDQHIILANSAKLSSLGEMAGSIAHEINNPLAIISASTLLLDRTIPKDIEKRAKVDKHIAEINKTVIRITQIVTGLRNLSRSDKIDEKELHTLRECIEDVVLLTKSKMRNRAIRLKFDMEDKIFDTQMNVQLVQINQVFMNLFNNSIDALTELEVKDEDDPWISINHEIRDGYHRIYFRDSGIGIKADKVNEIFVPYYTSKDFGKGTGLGLSLSRSILEKHGGSLSYDSSQASTCFIIEIPV